MGICVRASSLQVTIDPPCDPRDEDDVDWRDVEEIDEDGRYERDPYRIAGE